MELVAHILGIDNESSPLYAFWSGFGSDLPMFGALLVLLRKHNCHVGRCWRLGRHKTSVNGTELMVCRKHHPDDHPTAADVAHAAAAAAEPETAPTQGATS